MEKFTYARNTQFLTQSRGHSQTPRNLSVDHLLWFHGPGRHFFLEFLLLRIEWGCPPAQSPEYKLGSGREEAAVPSPVAHWPPNDSALTSRVRVSFRGKGSLITSTPDTWRTATSTGHLSPAEHRCHRSAPHVEHAWETPQSLGSWGTDQARPQHHVTKKWMWTLQWSHLFQQAGETQGYPSYT